MAITAGSAGGAQTFANTTKTLLWNKDTHGLIPRGWRFIVTGDTVTIEIEGDQAGANQARIVLPAGTSWDWLDTQYRAVNIYATAASTSSVITWGPSVL